MRLLTQHLFCDLIELCLPQLSWSHISTSLNIFVSKFVVAVTRLASFQTHVCVCVCVKLSFKIYCCLQVLTIELFAQTHTKQLCWITIVGHLTSLYKFICAIVCVCDNMCIGVYVCVPTINFISTWYVNCWKASEPPSGQSSANEMQQMLRITSAACNKFITVCRCMCACVS